MKKLIDFYSNTNQFINDAIDRIIVEIHLKKQKDGYKKFMLSGCEPGVGTTTLAISIAISMANAGWKTILIDGDLRKISRYKRLNQEVEIGLSDFLLGECLYHQAVYDTNYKNLFYIPSGGRAVNPISLLCSSNMDELMDQLYKEYDYIILDMPSITTSVDPNVMANKMDGIILVSEYAKTERRSVRESRDVLYKSGGNIIGIILNKIDTSEFGHIMKNFDYYKNQRYVSKRTKSKAKLVSKINK
ncbi:MAG: CpsD/CapB family tyrosine-protein kinase [Herbinix sp.]|jgi:capsular exopolysaccharide synthesis family protein|nr:CpsD/CapB family tyrosine-protein kinase [Herbinix sp.]